MYNDFEDFKKYYQGLELGEVLRRIHSLRTNGDLFIDTKVPYTPLNLLEEIDKYIGEVDFNAQIVVLYTIEWAIMRWFAGYKHIIVTTQNYCKTTHFWCCIFDFKYILLDDLINKIKRGEMGKFDLVIGNPPYQMNGSKNVVYQDVYNKALKLGDVVSLVTPKRMMDSLVKGKCEGTYITVVVPKFISFDNIEKHFDEGSTFCYFIIDQNNVPSKSSFKTTYGLIEVDPTKIELSTIDDEHKVSFLEKYFTYPKYKLLTNNTTEDKEIAGTDVLIFDKMQDNRPLNPRQIQFPLIGFRVTPYKPKVLFNMYSSGTQGEAYLDLHGNVLPSHKHCLNYLLLNTAAEAQQAYDALNSDVFKEFVSLFRARSTIWDFYRFVDFKDC